MQSKLLTALLLLSLTPLAAVANKETICQLVEADALTALGFDGPDKPHYQETTFPKESTDAPAAILSQACLLNSDKKAEGEAVFVVLETFSAEASLEAITTWFQQASERTRAQEPDAKIEESKIDDAICESGSYEMPGQDGQPTLQRYTACDRLIGKRHLTINLQRRDRQDAFPSPAQVKALLDTATRRLATTQR